MREETNSPQTSPQDIYDLSGKVFGPTTVLSLHHIHRGRRFWNTRCICGTERVLKAFAFKDAIPHCDTCEIDKLKASGEATPEDIMALGFDVTFLSRFWPKVNKNGPIPAHNPELGPCWIWEAGVNGRGYGCLAARFEDGKGVMVATHRASWMISNKQLVPLGLHVLHHCDTPRCLRPDHLFIGSDQINSDDKIAKGRDKHVIGEEHPNAKLTEEQVREIRAMYATGKFAYHELASTFKVSKTLIATVVRREFWRHIT